MTRFNFTLLPMGHSVILCDIMQLMQYARAQQREGQLAGRRTGAVSRCSVLRHGAVFCVTVPCIVSRCRILGHGAMHCHGGVCCVRCHVLCHGVVFCVTVACTVLRCCCAVILFVLATQDSLGYFNETADAAIGCCTIS